MYAPIAPKLCPLYHHHHLRVLIAIISVRTLKAPKIADLDSWPSNTQDNDTHNYNSIIIILFSYHDKPLNYVIDKEADQLFLLPRRRPLLWGRCWSSWQSSEANWDFYQNHLNLTKIVVKTWSMGISRPGNFSSVYLSLTAASSFGVIAAMVKVFLKQIQAILLSALHQTTINGLWQSGQKSIILFLVLMNLLLVSMSFSLNHELNCSSRTLVKREFIWEI